MLGDYSDFPELEGFKKNGKTKTTATRIVQGRRFTDLTVTQHYVPYGEGDFAIKPFQMTVNGALVRSKGATVHVGPEPANAAALTAPADPTAPLQAVGDLDKLFGKPKAALYEEVPDHAFLAVMADRPSVFVGEGVRVGLYFYLLPADQSLLDFHDFDDQIPPLLHELHQPTAWQQPGPEASVSPDTVRYQGRRYLRFRLAESVYYPLTPAPLRFPPLALTMVKFKVLKKPEPGQDNRLPGYKTYYSAGVQVQVRPLPDAARHGPVPVGAYKCSEAISRTKFRVGETFTYSFGVEGEGQFVGGAGAGFCALARPRCVWPRGAAYRPGRAAGASCFGTGWWPGSPAACRSIASCSSWCSTLLRPATIPCARSAPRGAGPRCHARRPAQARRRPLLRPGSGQRRCGPAAAGRVPRCAPLCRLAAYRPGRRGGFRLVAGRPAVALLCFWLLVSWF